MTAEAKAWIEKAIVDLSLGHLSRNQSTPEETVIRASAAIISASRAIIIGEGNIPSAQLTNIFEQAFVNTGRLDPRFLTDLQDAHRIQMLAADGIREQNPVTRERAMAMLSRASEFVTMAEELMH
jgi:uncharacterized protein (UPF0332 family)